MSLHYDFLRYSPEVERSMYVLFVFAYNIHILALHFELRT